MQRAWRTSWWRHLTFMLLASFAATILPPTAQAVDCGSWTVQTATNDSRLSAAVVTGSSGDNCQGTIRFENGTQLISDLGGYTLELSLSQTNTAGSYWQPDYGNGIGKNFLMPSRDVELHAIPLEVLSRSNINITGDITLRSFAVDSSFFVLKSLITMAPLPIGCVVQEDQIVNASVRVSGILGNAAALANQNDMAGALSEIKQITGEFVHRSADALKDIGVDCAIDALGKLVEASQIEITAAHIALDFVMWYPPMFIDTIRYQAAAASAAVTYEPKPSVQAAGVVPSPSSGASPVVASPSPSTSPVASASQARSLTGRWTDPGGTEYEINEQADGTVTASFAQTRYCLTSGPSTSGPGLVHNVIWVGKRVGSQITGQIMVCVSSNVTNTARLDPRNIRLEIAPDGNSMMGLRDGFDLPLVFLRVQQTSSVPIASSPQAVAGCDLHLTNNVWTGLPGTRYSITFDTQQGNTFTGKLVGMETNLRLDGSVDATHTIWITVYAQDGSVWATMQLWHNGGSDVLYGKFMSTLSPDTVQSVGFGGDRNSKSWCPPSPASAQTVTTPPASAPTAVATCPQGQTPLQVFDRSEIHVLDERTGADTGILLSLSVEDNEDIVGDGRFSDGRPIKIEGHIIRGIYNISLWEKSTYSTAGQGAHLGTIAAQWSADGRAFFGDYYRPDGNKTAVQLRITTRNFRTLCRRS